MTEAACLFSLAEKPHSPEEWLHRLAQNRLLAHVPLLVERGLAPGWLIDPASRLAPPANTHSESENRALAALSDEGLEVLLLKGALLEETLYAGRGSRSRCDLDVLIPDVAVDSARMTLDRAGFVPMFPHAGDASLAEQAWLDPSFSANWALDLHWRLLMHPALRDVLSFKELWRRSVSLPRQPAQVRGLSLIDALLHASMHYFGGGHRGAPAPLIWLLDIDLLWRELDSSGRSEAITRAADAGVAALLGSALRLAAQHFGTTLDTEEVRRIDLSGAEEWRSWLVRPFRSRAHDLWFELRSERSLRACWSRLISLALPSRDYMRWRYPEGSSLGVPGLYLRRAFGAVAKLARS